jgi:hypothetical protein
MSVATQIIRFGMMSGLHLDDQVGDHIGGSRSFARARLVTLGERLPGSFSVQCKIQKRSDDPGTRDDQAE